MFLTLVFPAFIAGLLTFLAPCTLPLVPGYLAFISGVSLQSLTDEEQIKTARKKMLRNAIFYCLGFSLVFIIFGSIFASLGQLGFAMYRPILIKISGAFILFLGLYMMRLFDLPFFRFLDVERRFTFTKHLVPGKPLSSFLFGATFAFGWTPCVGPVLGSILLLASTSTTVGQGAFLLAVFSLGLAVPFLLVALGVGQATIVIKRLSRWIGVISFVGGLFIAILGLLILTGNLGVWTGFFYNLFDVFHYNALLKYL